MQEVCGHCGHAIARSAGGAWIHDETGWRMCDLSAVTFADPHPVAPGTDPVAEQARKRAAELFEMAEDENWLGI